MGFAVAASAVVVLAAVLGVVVVGICAVLSGLNLIIASGALDLALLGTLLAGRLGTGLLAGLGGGLGRLGLGRRLLQRTQRLLWHPIVVDGAVVGGSGLDHLLGSGTLPLAGAAQQILLSDDQEQDNNAREQDVQEEGLAVQTLVDLRNQHGLIEDSLVVLNAIGIAVGQSNVQAKGTAGKLVRGQEGVRHGRLEAGLHLTVVGHRREVLDEVVEVHGIAEGGLHRLDDELLGSLVRESDQELDGLAAGQIQLLARRVQGFRKEQIGVRIRRTTAARVAVLVRFRILAGHRALLGVHVHQVVLHGLGGIGTELVGCTKEEYSCLSMNIEAK